MVIRRLFKRFKTNGRSASSAAVPVPQHPETKAKPPRTDSGPSKRRSHHGAPRHQKPHPKPKKWNLDDFQVPEKEGAVRFHDVELPDALMHAIADLGFEYCTPIQGAVLPHSISGRNIAGQAQTGTGKTAAFLLSIYARFVSDHKDAGQRGDVCRPKALILAPTRELVVQIARDAEGLGKYVPFRCLALYGGMDYERQQKKLRETNYDLIAATPGRLLDFSNQGLLSFAETKILVLDEADRMLDMGFIPDVRRIIRKLPPREKRQTMLFSATLSPDVLRLASNWMTDPEVIEIEPESVAVDTVEQRIYLVSSDDKLKVLYNLLKSDSAKRVLVFANRRDRCQRLADELEMRGLHCGLLSGAVTQKKRMKILEDFKGGRIPVVVATDVAGRGIHVDGVTHVVNYELPYEPEDYVHRIGRTGRAGEEGVSISFACEDESFIIPEIESYIGRELSCVMPEEDLMSDIPAAQRPPRSKTGGPGGRPSGGRGRQGGSGNGRRSGQGSRGPRRNNGGSRSGQGSRRADRSGGSSSRASR